jgi:hypothetical protein
MNYVKRFFGLLLMAMTLGMVSCNYTDEATPSFDSILWEDELGLTSSVEVETDVTDAELFVLENQLRARCIQVVFPVTIEFPDGTTADVNDGTEAKEAIKAYYEANGKGERPQIQLPFAVESKDGEVITIESREEIKDLLKECARDRKYGQVRDCFTLVYPVNVVLPNGDVVEVLNKEEMKALLKGWRIKNRGAQKRPRLQLPFMLQTEDGELIEIQSKEDMKAAIEDCRG